MTDDRQAPTADVREALTEALISLCVMPNHDFPEDVHDHVAEADAILSALRARGLVLANADDAVRVAAHALDQEWHVNGDTVEYGPDLQDRLDALRAALAAEYAALATPPEALIPTSAVHGYTCGLCQWGRDSAHGEAAYQEHMKHVHPAPIPERAP